MAGIEVAKGEGMEAVNQASESDSAPCYEPTEEALRLSYRLAELETKEILYVATAVLSVRRDGRKWAKLLMDNFER